MFSYPSPRDRSDPAAWGVRDSPSASALALPPVLRFGRCEVRVASREVLVDDQLRALQPRPFDLLLVLIESRARVRTTHELLDAVWRHQIVQPGSLAAAVMRIRQALREGEPGIGPLIRTYPRVGYRFVATLDGEVAR